MNDLNIEKIKSYLKKNLSSDRFFHSKKVAETARKLAKIQQGVNPQKAYIAGLLHDLARDMNEEELVNYCKNHRIKIDSFARNSPRLLHPYVGVKIAKNKFNFRDKEIVQAIERHCVPKPNMDLLDKILYLSDIIAPTPKLWPGIAKIFELSKKSLDQALLYAYNKNIEAFTKKGQEIHPDLIRTRNKLIKNLKKKILILGSQGMLGSALREKFRGYKVEAWDKKEIDIGKKKELQKKIPRLAPDVIINAAAYTDVEGAESNQKKALKVNGKAVGYLAQIAKKIDAVLVHYSTDYVFDGKNRKGYKENAQPNPVNVYGKSKFLGEALLRRNYDKYYLIRSAWMFGKDGTNFVDKMLQLSKARDRLQVVNDQRGKPTYAPDLAYATKQLLEKDKKFGIYHITNEGRTTWYQFARKLFDFKNIKVKIKPISSQEFKTQARRPLCSVLINTKLPKLRRWEEALGEYLH